MKPFTPARKAALVTAAMAGAGSVLLTLAADEGKRNTAYIPVPGDVPTICYGETDGVVLGMTKTDAECMALLKQSATEHGLGIAYCMKYEPPLDSFRSFMGLGYNIGTYKFCHSTLLRKLNANDLAGACDEIPKWNKFHGKKLDGLVSRRAREYAQCRLGLTSPAP